MDIKAELKEIILHGADADNLVKDIAIQQEELLKKSHLLKVISFSNKMEKFVAENVFVDSDIGYLELESLYNASDNAEIEISFLSEHKKDYIGDKKLRYLIKGALKDIQNCSKEFLHESFNNKNYILDLKLGIGNKILEIFLSDQLKKVYDYSKMQAELSENNNQEKKLKI